MFTISKQLRHSRVSAEHCILADTNKTKRLAFGLHRLCLSRKGVFKLMNKTFILILVMIMLITSLPCTALAETTAAPAESGTIAEPEASEEPEVTAEPEASEEPEVIAEPVLSVEKAAAGNVIASAGEAIISSLGDHFGLGIFGDIGSTLFGELMGGIFGDDTDEQLIEMLTQVQKQLDELSRKIDVQTQEIKKAITDSELSSDLRKVNEIYAQTDRLYADYTAILAITDEEVRTRELDSFFNSTVPKANLRSMITSSGAYLTKSSGGSPSLCNMYFDSCCETYTFEHQMADGVNAFYIYHLGNMQKMLMLYNDWCEYTAADKSDPNDAKMLELNRTAAEAGKIYSAIAQQLRIPYLTKEIAHTGTDALGNSVSYYIVRLNSDHRRYVIVDKAYSYGTFYGNAKETYYVAGMNDIRTYLQSQKTSGYDKLMSTLPTNKEEVLTGMVIANPKDADSFYAKAARNGILSYLESYGMKLNSANTSKANAFVFSDAVAHSEKSTRGILARNYGEVSKKNKIISSESYYLHYFLSNANEKKLKKDMDYIKNLSYQPTIEYAEKIGKYEDVKLSGGNSHIVFYADYSIKFYNKEYFDYPMYLIYKLDEDLDYTGNVLNTQAGGVFEMYFLGINVWWFIGIGAVLVIGAAGVVVVIVRRKRKKKN